MSSYLVTGAGRGLGLELVTQLSKLPSSQTSIVLAATRSKPSEALQKLIDGSNGRVIHILLDVSDKVSIERAVPQIETQLAGKGLDVLINNAGVMPFVSDGIRSMDNLRQTFDVNVDAVHNTMAALIPIMKQGKEKKIMNVSTTLGSMTLSPNYAFAPAPAYKITKAALNMLTVQYAAEFEKEGFTIFLISPGWLKTDLGGEQADLPVEVGANATLDVLFKSTTKDNGKYLNVFVSGWENAKGPNVYDGKGVPW